MLLQGNLRRMFCLCDMKTCREMFSEKDRTNWLMRGITFGVHPKIVKQIGKVCVIKRTFHFCDEHYIEAMSKVIDGFVEVVKAYNGGYFFSESGELEDSMGCWITFTDVLGGSPPKNSQMSYRMFEKIYKLFTSELDIKQDSPFTGMIVYRF